MAKDITVRWAGKRRFEGTNESGHTVVMDATLEAGGEGAAPTPLEMVLHGLAACTAIDIVAILEKKRQPLEGLSVEVHAEQRTDGPPSPYQTIDLVYVIEGDVAPKAIDSAVNLSYEKYCSVKAMFGPQVTVNTAWRYSE